MIIIIIIILIDKLILRTNEMKKNNQLTIFPSAIPLEMCYRVIELGETLDFYHGKVSTETGPEIVMGSRQDNIALIPSNPSTSWIYDEMWEIIKELNRRNWQFELNAIETLQYSTYHEGHFFGWHRDNVPAFYRKLKNASTEITRKLTISVQLSDPNEYVGGHFEVNQNETGDEESDNQADASPRSGELDLTDLVSPRGTITAFPSVFRHRVSPIRKGTRRSLVAWAGGPPADYDSY